LTTSERSREGEKDEKLLASRLAYYLCCLAEDATNLELSSVERLALVRERVAWIREIRRELEHPGATYLYLTPEKIRRNVTSTA